MSYLVNRPFEHFILLTLTSLIKAHVYHLCNTRWADIRTTCPHRLSLLFAILAIGALFDPSRAQLPDADDYYHLSRVALALKSAVTETTVNAVSAIVSLISFFKIWADFTDIWLFLPVYDSCILLSTWSIVNQLRAMRNPGSSSAWRRSSLWAWVWSSCLLKSSIWWNILLFLILSKKMGLRTSCDIYRGLTRFDNVWDRPW